MKPANLATFALAAAVISSPVSAAETLVFAPGGSVPSGYAAVGAPLIFTSSSGETVSVTGWSVDQAGKIRAGQLGLWSAGLGVKNSSSDDSHTIDNSGWVDFILVQFSQSVTLDQAKFNTGWHGMSDTDATIGFGILPIGNVSSLAGTTWPISWLTTFPSGGSGGGSRDVNPQGMSGNIWLIGASYPNPDRKLDGFKLESLTFKSAVPEPGTWMMMVLGFGLLGATLRYRRRAASNVAFSF